MLAARAGLVSGLPLMHRTSYIRLARVEEAAALSDLCFRSKAVWGYDPEFMALMPAVLGSPERISLPAMCGSRPEPTGKLPGVLALAPGDEPGALDLEQAVRRAAPCPRRRRPGRYPRTRLPRRGRSG
jgi:hypothetical protein